MYEYADLSEGNEKMAKSLISKKGKRKVLLGSEQLHFATVRRPIGVGVQRLDLTAGGAKKVYNF